MRASSAPVGFDERWSETATSPTPTQLSSSATSFCTNEAFTQSGCRMGLGGSLPEACNKVRCTTASCRSAAQCISACCLLGRKVGTTCICQAAGTHLHVASDGWHRQAVCAAPVVRADALLPQRVALRHQVLLRITAAPCMMKPCEVTTWLLAAQSSSWTLVASQPEIGFTLRSQPALWPHINLDTADL